MERVRRLGLEFGYLGWRGGGWRGEGWRGGGVEG